RRAATTFSFLCTKRSCTMFNAVFSIRNFARLQASLRTRYRSVLRVEQLESLVLLSCDPNAVFREFNGHCGNPAHENFGMAGIDLIRKPPVAYGDGISPPSGANRPSARAISNLVSDQSDPSDPDADRNVLDNRRLSAFIFIFGQILDHDMDLT